MPDSKRESTYPPELEAVLEERARALAAPVRGVRDRAEPTHVVFEADGIRFAIAVSSVLRIVRDPRTTRIPGAPERLARVMYEDGRIVSLVDPCAIVGRSGAFGPRGMVLVIGHERRRIGVFADAVTSLTSRDSAEIVSTSNEHDRGRFVLGTTRSVEVVLDAVAIVERVAEDVVP